jgi:hypothetical protein
MNSEVVAQLGQGINSLTTTLPWPKLMRGKLMKIIAI